MRRGLLKVFKKRVHDVTRNSLDQRVTQLFVPTAGNSAILPPLSIRTVAGAVRAVPVLHTGPKGRS